MTLYASVVFPLPVDRVFVYKVPPLWEGIAGVGSRVLAPFGEKRLTGFVVDLKTEAPAGGLKLKEIEEVLDREPAFGEKILSFTRSLSDHYFSSWGEVLHASLPPSLVLRTRTRFALSESGENAYRKRELSGEEDKLASLLSGKLYTFRHLKKTSAIGNLPLVVSRMRKRGLLQVLEEMKRARRRKEAESRSCGRQLEFDLWPGSAEDRAIGKIASTLGRDSFSPHFLVGRNGGREIVYFGLIGRALSLGGQALFLVPEISVGSTLSCELVRRFGERVAILHGRLAPKSRESEWRRIRRGEAEVVVGPRSALFSPLPALKLIIVDREEDDSHLQTENPPFDVRRGAWMRATIEKAVCVYGSSRPTVEGFYRAREGGYDLRLGDPKPRSRVTIVDDRPERELVGQRLKSRIADRLKQKGPVILFFNRRGFASSLFCPRCDYTPRCARCDIALAYHKRDERLVCHYCNSFVTFDPSCPRCGSLLIKKRGAGIEAVEEELRRAFPASRVTVFDSDAVKSERQRVKILRDFQNGKIPILLGTQLLARQINLPPVTLVGILFPETVLALSDYRAGQKTFQTVRRMMEFALDDPLSEIIIQTATPDHYALRAAAAGDYQAFFEEEIRFRELMNYPPFSQLAEVTFRGEDLRSLGREIRKILPRLRSLEEGVEILGPALASVPKVRGLSRIQLTLKAGEREPLGRILREIRSGFRGRKSILVSD